MHRLATTSLLKRYYAGASEKTENFFLLANFTQTIEKKFVGDAVKTRT